MAWSGLFKERIDLMIYTNAPNEYGETVRTLKKVRSTWAKVTHLSGSRTVRNDEIQYPYQKVIAVRYHVNIDENMLIKWKDNLYRIQSIDPNVDLQQKTIICEIVNE